MALYLISETFGATVLKEAIAWQDDRLLFGPAGTCETEADLQPGYRLARGRDDAVNEGLRAIRVRASAVHDEYATVGLPKLRMIEDWLAN